MTSDQVPPVRTHVLFAWVVTLAAMAWPLAGAAQGAEQIDEIRCNPAGTQQEMNVCDVDAYKAADRALNRQYKLLMGRVEPQRRGTLRAAQRRWIVQRDTRCEAETKGLEGGNAWAGAVYACLRIETERRTRELARPLRP